MDACNVVENIYLLAIITVLSILQNVFFALKVEKECTGHNTHAVAIERVSCANRNCTDAYPTFMVVMWCAGVCLNQAPAAFAGLLYLVVRHKYFIGYMDKPLKAPPATCLGSVSCSSWC
ncbi:hypothetical protein WMY93_007698 [Mugilogobius chulae]|uniref:Arachidonate 5-lipoxygenase-activating protein n=1 Tax=Mugilogobius chulae TaxID=88201 RepID=A0AAW0PH38_9GOBI